MFSPVAGFKLLPGTISLVATLFKTLQAIVSCDATSAFQKIPHGGEIFNIESFDEIGVSMHLPGRIRIGGTGTDRFVEAATLGRFVISS